jgi:hypothetical protein
VPVGEDQELPEVPLRFWPAADPEKVDDLDEQPSPSSTRLTDGAHQLRQATDEPVVPDPEKRTAGNVSDSGGLDDQRPRLPPRDALVPRQDLRRDQPVVGGTPGHHGRNPGALSQVEPAGAEGAEPERLGGLLRSGWMRHWDGIFDEGLGVPHASRLMANG